VHFYDFELVVGFSVEEEERTGGEGPLFASDVLGARRRLLSCRQEVSRELGVRGK
jgi:hypothetical protein